MFWVEIKPHFELTSYGCSFKMKDLAMIQVPSFELRSGLNLLSSTVIFGTLVGREDADAVVVELIVASLDVFVVVELVELLELVTGVMNAVLRDEILLLLDGDYV